MIKFIENKFESHYQVLDKKNYGIIIVPPGILFSFTTKNKISVVANFLNNPHSYNENLKMNKIKN